MCLYIFLPLKGRAENFKRLAKVQFSMKYSETFCGCFFTYCEPYKHEGVKIRDKNPILQHPNR